MPGAFSCSICLNEDPSDPIVTCCGHLFCWPCMQGWISTKSPPTCPVCMGIFKDISSFIPVNHFGRKEHTRTQDAGTCDNENEDGSTKLSAGKRKLRLRRGVDIPISKFWVQGFHGIKLEIEFEVRSFEVRRKIHVTPVIEVLTLHSQEEVKRRTSQISSDKHKHGKQIAHDGSPNDVVICHPPTICYRLIPKVDEHTNKEGHQ
ncbi:hypothetical protein KP509_14G017500 [Ceratopteris richardii]|uniref:RING-type E3 ubiquitin transferase n=1 Tax=Ceratopteris richardii TaxID=49495 RepID=A0A8T2TB09_CERRI|nr:hypothetical protein KP509_14G017500 [Ceratopteris richardii]